jgi:ADP-ribose pyrophosphatase YjhB (NUDIX family)
MNYWTVPAGFMENGETLLEGAQREAKEEVGIKPMPSNLFMVYSVPHISQVHFYFYSELKDSSTKIGEEINEVMFADYNEIPWDDLAFNSIRVLLKHFFKVGEEKAASSFFNLSSIE